MRTGTGTYSLPAGVGFVNGQTADGGMVQTAFNDVASALTSSLASDGQTAWAGNMNGGGYILSNITVNGINVTASNAMTITGAGSTTALALTFGTGGSTPSGFYMPTATSIAMAISGLVKWTQDADKFYLNCGALKFPASQSPSTDANTLDDYEEGTWVPTGNGVTLTVSVAKYIKVGKQVNAYFDVTWPSTADTGNARVASLPFTCDSTMLGSVPLSYNNSGTSFLAVVQPNTTYVEMATVSGTVITNANLSTKRLIGSASYLASA